MLFKIDELDIAPIQRIYFPFFVVPRRIFAFLRLTNLIDIGSSRFNKSSNIDIMKFQTQYQNNNVW